MALPTDDDGLAPMPSLKGEATPAPPDWWVRDSLHILTQNVSTVSRRVNQLEVSLGKRVDDLASAMADLTLAVGKLVTQGEERNPRQQDINKKVEALPEPDKVREAVEMVTAAKARKEFLGDGRDETRVVISARALWVAGAAALMSLGSIGFAVWAHFHPIPPPS